MDAAELKRRTKRFALQCMAVADRLPETRSGRTVGNQLVRSGTSVAANYRSACRSRSSAEFASKMGVVEEEADETALWVELMIESHMLPENDLQPLWKEADELTRIAVASIRTTRGGSSSIRNPKSAIRNRNERNSNAK
jgi:four helix bundle protein